MHPYVVLDVFTDVPLQGNQVAVFDDGAGLSTELMQRTARELNLSETVFLLAPDSVETADARLRIFTPATELPFAGHPTLGSAFVVGRRQDSERVRLQTGAGIVAVALRREGEKIVFGEMEQPIPVVEPFEPAAELLQALGVERSGLPIEAYRNGPVHLYVELPGEAGGRGAGARPARPRCTRRGRCELLRGRRNQLQDPDVRARARRFGGPGDGVRRRPAGRSPGPARANRVRRADRDPAGSRDRAALGAATRRVDGSRRSASSGCSSVARRCSWHRGSTGYRRVQMKLTDRRRRALEDICDAFCPSGDGAPTARELRVADAVLAAVALNPRESERRQLAQLLSLWDSPVLGALGGAGRKRFSELPASERERVLRSWRDSRVPQRRAVFQALRKAALLFYYMVPGRDGGRNPAWDAIGYDGPLGKLEHAPRKALTITPVQRDTTLSCDVVIVGSGAGGGAAAGVLAGAGLDVIVIESGDYYDDRDFDGSEFGAFTRYYMGAPVATHDQSVALLAGSCLGAARSSTTRHPSGPRTRCEPSGRARRPGVHLRAVLRQSRRGLRAARRQPGAQRAVLARPQDAGGVR